MTDKRLQPLIDTEGTFGHDTLEDPPSYSEIVTPLPSTSSTSTATRPSQARPPTPPRSPSPDRDRALRNFKQTQPPTNRFVLTSSGSEQPTVASIVLDPSATPPAHIVSSIPLKVSAGPLKGKEFPPKGKESGDDFRN
ncbi:hypothetical protein BT69DRAFT_301503 [Atractiella rhizophila]|nr:hypothetical protein BT69DRAFT_301503 [Atractiella rhizophila]